MGAEQTDKNPETKEGGKAGSISGAVILYNPGLFVIDNIMSYIDYLDVLYVVDNSDTLDPAFIYTIKRIPRVCYISLCGNHGIAKALNTSASLALNHGYDWLLTMDQDSRFEENILPRMFHCLNVYDKDTIGMICARYTKKNRYVEVYGKKYNEVLVSITSGSLINLTVFRKHGPFMEKLFIDHVDHEYCLRLGKHGYKIIQVKDAFIRHRLGNSKKYLVCRSSNHVSSRRYFMTRNRFYVANMYKNDWPKFFRTEMLRFAGELVKILLFEKEKYKKLGNIAMGYLDYKKNKFDRDLNEL